jgi:glycogen synthase
MRIVFLTPEYPPFGFAGGIGSYLSIVAPTLAARGHEVHVIACTTTRSDDILDKGVNVHLRPLRSLPLMGRMSRLSQTHDRLAAARSYAKALRDLDEPDVIESPEWMAESLGVRGKARGTRLLVHLHTPVGLIARHGDRLGRDAALANRLEILSIRRSRAVSSPSKLLLDHVFPAGLPRGALTRVIRPPIDLESWHAPTGESRSERVVLVVGRLERLKGIDTLLEAIAALPDELRATTRLVAVGRSSGLRDGRPYAESLVQLAERSGVQFEHRDEVPRAELAGIYSTARVVVLPSRFESFGMVAVEAMVMGVPVVCSSATGVSELVRGTDAGAVVPAEDPAALMSALVGYLEDERAATKAGAIGRALVEAECAPDVIAEQRERLYGEMRLT